MVIACEKTYQRVQLKPLLNVPVTNILISILPVNSGFPVCTFSAHSSQSRTGSHSPDRKLTTDRCEKK